jgi:hypothetical protein
MVEFKAPPKMQRKKIRHELQESSGIIILKMFVHFLNANNCKLAMAT